MAADAQRYMTVPEAAEALEVSERSVHRWVKLGRLRAVRLPSGRRRILREDVLEILEPTTAGAA